jgi:single-stranded DNA-binding protein
MSGGSRVVVGRLQQRSWTAEDGSALIDRGGCGRGVGAEPAVGDGDHDQDNEEPGRVASSTSAAGSGTRVQEQHASVPLRRC